MADPEGNGNAYAGGVMGPEVDGLVYARDLEEHRRRVLFDQASLTASEAAVLLVRGALAGGDRARAAQLARGAQGLADARPDDREMATAAAHARGLVERNPSPHGDDGGVGPNRQRRASPPAAGWASLTDKERQVVELVARGLSNREAARQLFLSEHTVAFHLRHVFQKLDIGSRVQLARLVAEKAVQAPAR